MTRYDPGPLADRARSTASAGDHLRRLRPRHLVRERQSRTSSSPAPAAYVARRRVLRGREPRAGRRCCSSRRRRRTRMDAPPAGRRIVRYDGPARPLPASGDREFRYLVTDEVGCTDLTQFYGVIAPGRAPDHSHVYDEVIYVLEGVGTLHYRRWHEPVVGGHVHPSTAVARALARERRRHADEGSSPSSTQRGDPASRAYEANEMTAIGVSFKYRVTQQEGNMKKVVVAAVLAAVVAVLATAALGSTRSARARSASASNADTALDRSAARHALDRPDGAVHRARQRRSGSTRCTGRTSHRNSVQQDAQDEDQVRQRGHAARLRRTERLEAVKGAQALGSNSAAVLGVVGPAGSNEVKATTGAPQGRRPRLRLRARRRTHDDHDGRHRGRASSSAPSPPDSSQSKSVCRLHHRQAEGEAGLHHRRPGGLQHRPRRRGAEHSSRPSGVTVSPRRRQPAAVGLLVADQRRSRATRSCVYISVAAAARRVRRSVSR